jgi:2-phosphosulfolactate phosphatase
MKPPRLEVFFSPAEFAALKSRDLRGTICVVFDILRATTSIVAALSNGASAVVPVETIEEAVALRRNDPGLLLAGERHGLRITAELSGGIDFDFGNSPREFQADKVRGKLLAMTTTNGTRGLKACVGADAVLAASFLNLAATESHVRERGGGRILLICSGTYEEASYEDTLAAGALVHAFWPDFQAEEIADSAQIARNIFLSASSDLLGAMRFARNGRRLLEMPDLAADVPFCLQRDTAPIVAALSAGQVVRIDHPVTL